MGGGLPRVAKGEPMPDMLDILNRAAALQQAGAPFALCTVTYSQRPTSARAGAKAVVTPDGAIFGWVGGACSQPSVVRHAREALALGEPRTIRLSPDGSGGGERDGLVVLAMTCHSGGTLEIFIEPVLPEPYLVVVGDTPVAHALVQIGRALDYRTVALACVNSGADEEHAGLAFDTFQRTRVPFVVIASQGTLDEEALLGALALDPPYLAVVGSRRRIATMLDFLRLSGATEEQLSRIHAPAGLDIQAGTPAEIALSILAEITAIRRQSSFMPSDMAEAPAEPAGIVIDPICGMEVDLATARFTLERGGEVIGFCCLACLREYERLEQEPT